MVAALPLGTQLGHAESCCYVCEGESRGSFFRKQNCREEWLPSVRFDGNRGEPILPKLSGPRSPTFKDNALHFACELQASAPALAQLQLSREKGKKCRSFSWPILAGLQEAPGSPSAAGPAELAAQPWSPRPDRQARGRRGRHRPPSASAALCSPRGRATPGGSALLPGAKPTVGRQPLKRPAVGQSLGRAAQAAAKGRASGGRGHQRARDYLSWPEGNLCQREVDMEPLSGAEPSKKRREGGRGLTPALSPSLPDFYSEARVPKPKVAAEATWGRLSGS